MRKPEIDVLRAVAISLVVIYHMNYFTDYWPIRSLVNYSSVFGLSLFFFISGVSIHYSSSHESVLLFIRKRLLRIYPLFLLASATSLLLNPNPLNRMLSVDYSLYLLNISPLVLPRFDIQTGYWFVGAILFCYLIYINLNRYSKCSRDWILLSLLAVVALVICRYFLGIIMARVLVFMCIFLFGVLAQELELLEGRNWIIFPMIAVFAGSLFVFLEYFYSSFPDENILTFKHIVIYISAFLLMTFSFNLLSYKSVGLLIRPGMLLSIVSAIGFGAYATYLFHMTVLGYVKGQFNNGLYLVLIGLPMSLVVGYCIQKAEARCIGLAIRLFKKD